MSAAKKTRSSISKARTYKEMGEYWDTHSVADVWDKTQPVEFEIDLPIKTTYMPLDADLAKKLRAAAKKRHVSVERLLNSWVQEKLS